jgi:site-specific DNA-methyltransferase (adenine-specific)
MKNKPYYDKNGITIYNGDCIEIMKQFNDKSFDIVLTDPPYGINFQSNYRKIKHDKIVNDDVFNIEAVNEFFRLAINAVYVFCRWDNLITLPKPKSFIVWVKNNWSMGDLKHEHGRQWEGIAFYPQEKHKFIKRIPDVINAKRTKNNLHPTEKPVELIEELIKNNEGDLIIDPFMGSGTTLVAARNLGRKAIGIELSEKYCEIAVKRLNENI